MPKRSKPTTSPSSHIRAHRAGNSALLASLMATHSLSIKQIAEMLHVPVRTARRWCELGPGHREPAWGNVELLRLMMADETARIDLCQQAVKAAGDLGERLTRANLAEDRSAID